MNALRKSAPWIAAVAVPVAGYFLYQSLTPAQKKKLKRSVTEGTLSFASALLSRTVGAYKQNQVAQLSTGQAQQFETMARIPNRDESETTIGDEKWQ